MQNIRPITLLEHIKLKLFTRIIMQRIDRVMEVNKDKLLEREQFAGVKGGSTSDPLFIRRSVVEHCKEGGGELQVGSAGVGKPEGRGQTVRGATGRGSTRSGLSVEARPVVTEARNAGPAVA